MKVCVLTNLVLQPFRCGLVLLAEVWQSKRSLICPIDNSMHAVIVMSTVTAAIHIHPPFSTDLIINKREKRGKEKKKERKTDLNHDVNKSKNKKTQNERKIRPYIATMDGFGF